MLNHRLQNTGNCIIILGKILYSFSVQCDFNFNTVDQKSVSTTPPEKEILLQCVVADTMNHASEFVLLRL